MGNDVNGEATKATAGPLAGPEAPHPDADETQPRVAATKRCFALK